MANRDNRQQQKPAEKATEQKPVAEKAPETTKPVEQAAAPEQKPVEAAPATPAAEQQQAVAVQKPAAQPARLPAGVDPALAAAMGEDAGLGTSQRAEDNLVPLVYILQALSPQVIVRNPAQIVGAKASDIWLRNSVHEIVDGDGGFVFQPCHFWIDWVQWRPRDAGGGFQGRHPTRPAEATEIADPKDPNQKIWVMPNGDHLKETRNHAGFALGGEFGLKDWPDFVAPFVIPMSGSQHSASRQWMSLMNQFSIGGGRVAPSWARKYRLQTKTRKNIKGEWFGWTVTDAGWISTPDDYQRGKNLFESFNRGDLRPEAEVVDGDVGGGSQEQKNEEAAQAGL